jgi:phosphonate transport system ATP-binding protein
MAMSEQQHPLRIDDLVVRYGRGEPVISGVSIALGPKEIVGLIGASAAGKSTLLRAVQRLVEPESGQILLDGVDLTRLPREELRGARRRLGMIFQEHALIERLTVMENVLAGTLGRTGFWRSVRRRFDPDDIKEAFGLLDRVGLTGLEDSRCDELSGGQKQRVGIARALIQHPDVLLVDEPTASLDPATSVRIMGLITEICSERNLAAIINLHDVPLARRFCPRIIGLLEGRVAFDGPPSALDDAVLQRVYGDEATRAHADAAGEAGPTEEEEEEEEPGRGADTTGASAEGEDSLGG